MVMSSRFSLSIDSLCLMIRPLGSLTPEDAVAVAREVAVRTRRWSVDTHQDYEGYLTLFVAPTDSRDGDMAYVIGGGASGVTLARMDRDRLTELGRFDDVAAAVARLVEALPEPAWRRAAALTSSRW